MKIRILGAHNCESSDTKLTSLLIDDILALDAGALASTLSFSAQQKLQAILLTHHHYDHIRDIPAIAMNALLDETTISVYSIASVRNALTDYLLNDELYPDFFTRPEGSPTINFTVIKPGEKLRIAGYEVRAVPVNHAVAAVGYQVTASNGAVVFYTGDTGPGLDDCWQQVSPQLIITEITAPNRYEAFARDKGHLTPVLLAQELDHFQRQKGYLPQVIAVHMNPRQEKEIASEIARINAPVKASISLAQEGMLIDL